MKTTLSQHTAYSKDPFLFMQDNFLVFNAFKKMQCETITPFDYQLDVLNHVHKSNFTLLLKSRQMHVSSIMALYIAWYVLFNKDKNVGILSHSSDSGKRILESVRVILQNYSVDNEKNGKVTKTYFHWEDDFIINNKTEIKLSNDCRIKVFVPSPDACRAHRLDLLYIDEAAFIKNFEEMWMGLAMCLSSNKGKCILASTPSDNSHFNKMYLDSIEGKNDIVSIKLHWSIHPIYSKGISKTDADSPFEYTSYWFEETCARFNYSQKTIEQELECVVNYKDKTSKNKTISLRLDYELFKKLKSKLKPDETASDYIRNLIEKDCEDIPDKL